MKVIMARKYGFCMGVKRAVEIAEKAALDNSSTTILHQIVHNPSVVSSLARKGVKSVEGIENVQTKTVVFSAHGVSPWVSKEAKKKGLKIIDATCPIVEGVHQKVKEYAKRGYKIIYVGHRGHPEPTGVIGEALESVTLIERVDEVENLFISNPDKLVVLTQTTLSIDDTSEIIEAIRQKYPEAVILNRICGATTERQTALKELLPTVDIVVVVGGHNSSNSQRLADMAKKAGKKGYLVETADDLKKKWFYGVKNVGLTAGASTPDYDTYRVKKAIEQL